MKILLTMPTYNEELVIAENLRIAYLACEQLLAGHEWTVLVADNGSSDQTQSIVRELAATFPRLELWTTAKKGRGHALRSAWGEFDADVYAYMDADLATDLAHIPELIAALASADLAVGSRLSPTSKVERSIGRELISRCYSLISRSVLPLPVSDLQCGFKAMRKEAVAAIVPKTTHDGWFFDTELIALADHHGFTVVEVPVAWQEAPDRRRKSSVKIWQTAIDDLKHLWKLRQRLKKERE